MTGIVAAHRTYCWLLLGALLSSLTLACEEGTRSPLSEPEESSGVAGAGGRSTDLQSTDLQNPTQQPDPMTERDVLAPLGKLTTADGMIKIMPIGDSITRATCWRASLWDRLNQSFAGRFDFVGTLSNNPGCQPGNFDQDNQGYSTSLVTEIVAGIQTRMGCDPDPCPKLADLEQAFLMKPADVALIHFGTNDVWNSKSPEDIVNGYTKVIEGLRAANPKMLILVAQLIPMNVTAATCTGCTCAGCVTGIPTLNTRILSWAAELDTDESPIRVVDQYTGYDASVDNREGVHPNVQGSQKIAARWYDALAPLF